MALARMGHRERGAGRAAGLLQRAAHGEDARGDGGPDYQISVVRYFGDGAEEPFFTEEGATNIEFDDWGSCAVGAGRVRAQI